MLACEIVWLNGYIVWRAIKMWSPDLSAGQGPLYLRLVEAMAGAIAAGELKVGERLPPQRQLAWHLNINPSTVAKAFREAAKRHLIAGEVGRGTWVLGQSSEAELFELKQRGQSRTIDLSTHIPAVRSDDNDLGQALSALLQREQGVSEFLDYHTPHGLQRIRLAAARWLAQLGYPIAANHCVVTSTAQNALLVTLLASCGKNETVLVDELTFPGMKAVARQLGLRLHGVKADAEGLLPDALDLALRTTGAGVLVSDPTLQNPTGSSMGDARRRAITDLVSRHGILFIEEYVIGALSGLPPVTVAIRNDSVLISSFAKAVAPGIRFAVVAGGHPVIDKLCAESHASSWQLSPLMAEVACQWINSGVAERRRQWQWSETCRRYRLFRRIFPTTDYPGNSKVCSHVWLPVNGDSDQVAERCRELGVEVVPASTFAVGRSCPQCIRVSLTAARDLQQLKIALEIIRDIGVVRRGVI